MTGLEDSVAGQIDDNCARLGNMGVQIGQMSIRFQSAIPVGLALQRVSFKKH